MGNITSLSLLPTSTTNPTSDSFYAVWNDTDYRVTLESMRSLVMPPVAFIAAIEHGSVASGFAISSYVAANVVGSDYYNMYDTNTPSAFWIRDDSIAAVRFTYNLWFSGAAGADVFTIYKNGSEPSNAWERMTYGVNEPDDLVSVIGPYMSCNSGDYFEAICTFGTLSINTANSLSYMSIEIMRRR